jgi:hypothetical protein
MSYKVDADGLLIVPDAATLEVLNIAYRTDVKSLPNLPTVKTAYLRGCTALTGVDLPTAEYADLSGCTARDGLPEAKSCLIDLRNNQRLLAALHAKRRPLSHEFSEAKKRLDDVDDEIRSVWDQISSLADGVIANLDYEIEENLPSQWKTPVKIAITEGATT